MKRLLLIIILFFLIFNILPQNVSASTWLTGFGYRKVLNIAGSTAGVVTNYQVKITLNKGSGTDTSTSLYLNNHVLSSFNDIRFTTDDGTTLLSYGSNLLIQTAPQFGLN